tara:strand:- start:362 stop:664 length:303 start_codon:yes stop_codon:yes gene_type:complete
MRSENMYGTIFTLKPKQGQKEKLVELLKRDNETPDGMIGWFLMEPDEKEELIGVAIFNSRESHVANSNRPEQHEFFLEMMNYLESEPEWTDGNYIIGETA